MVPGSPCVNLDLGEGVLTVLCCQDGEVYIQEKRSGTQELLWNPSPEVRSSRLKRKVVHADHQGEFESER